MHAFREVETAAYCPRKLYYRQRDADTEETPERVKRRRELAFEYDRLRSVEGALAEAPVAVTPTQYRANLGCARARIDYWDELVNPTDRDVFLRGRDCYGVVHKILEAEMPTPSLVFGGEPPEQGVWEPQSVRLVAAAKALSWERELSVDRAVAEYPGYGVVRQIDIDTRRTAAYRSARRTVSAIDGPPAKTSNRSKCGACEYRDQCGVSTRSLSSLLGG
ncbi:CRISPR-associated exonuclease Cas4 [Halovenus aranensis]|uniref:CRISPR-associated exonuclease Cas4 n=1 Tax=Halovenus aranensis TaxID=890420 RepID=A0A1G8TJM4_9EURY|nr:hypothetical protein [Halovenus aranensis]SDJ41607.1 CRISPR-associated exonuclease Cas4 [Halovenus aranensis]